MQKILINKELSIFMDDFRTSTNINELGLVETSKVPFNYLESLDKCMNVVEKIEASVDLYINEYTNLHNAKVRCFDKGHYLLVNVCEGKTYSEALANALYQTVLNLTCEEDALD